MMPRRLGEKCDIAAAFGDEQRGQLRATRQRNLGETFSVGGRLQIFWLYGELGPLKRRTTRQLGNPNVHRVRVDEVAQAELGHLKPRTNARRMLSHPAFEEIVGWSNVE